MVLRLTPGNVSDIRTADDLIAAAGRIGHLIADEGYDADPVRARLRSQGAKPVFS